MHLEMLKKCSVSKTFCIPKKRIKFKKNINYFLNAFTIFTTI